MNEEETARTLFGSAVDTLDQFNQWWGRAIEAEPMDIRSMKPRDAAMLSYMSGFRAALYSMHPNDPTLTAKMTLLFGTMCILDAAEEHDDDDDAPGYL